MTIYGYIGLVGCCFLLLAIIMLFIKNEKTDRIGLRCIIIGTILAVFGAIGHTVVTTPKHPTAIDVYRGKTTLEITYRDSVAVDSVVVYKMK